MGLRLQHLPHISKRGSPLPIDLTNISQYNQYTQLGINAGDQTPTIPAAAVPTNRAQEDALVTPGAPIAEQKVIGREERIEYRDQDGNLLNDEQVAALIAEGSATFQTKYETRTRLVDAAGNEIPEGRAPEHPDAEGASPETKKGVEGEGAQPVQAQIPSGSENKERDSQAKPASEANEATK